ncbi:MAG TPA: phosphatidate cytidylyltransferase [Gemmatimonadaceae bacterium]|jgi:phosphatidate cytidylyltransferase
MPRSNLAIRTAFAVVAIPIVLLTVYAGGVVLALLLALAAGLAAWEYFRLARAAGQPSLESEGIVLAVLLPLAVHAYRTGDFNPPVLTFGAIIILLLMILGLWRMGVEGLPISGIAITVFGVLYTSGMLTFAYALRYHNYAVGARAGALLLLYPLLLTWTSDTAAYFAGRALGRHKLIPAVSPGKTVEGAVGALVLTALVSWFYAHDVLAPGAELALTTANAVLFGVVISVAVQFGDLVESLFKRAAGVKDSSNIIPGHGGVLDRLDGLFFALPVAYLVFTLPHVLIPALR